MVLGEVLTCSVGDLCSGEPKPGVRGPPLRALVVGSLVGSLLGSLVRSLVGSSIENIRLSEP